MQMYLCVSHLIYFDTFILHIAMTQHLPDLNAELYDHWVNFRMMIMMMMEDDDDVQ